jgi:hypothetical protein
MNRLRSWWRRLADAWRVLRVSATQPEVVEIVDWFLASSVGDESRFRVIRWHRDGREVLVNQGGNGGKARADYEQSCRMPTVVRVEFWDGGERRGVWSRGTQ